MDKLDTEMFIVERTYKWFQDSSAVTMLMSDGK